MQFKRSKFMSKKGFFLPIILIFASLFFAYSTALVSYSIANIKSTTISNKKISALSIAEAGINYYLWHMEHYPDDFCDLKYKADGSVNGEIADNTCKDKITKNDTIGKNRPELVGFSGPYTHKYFDNSDEIGTYNLYIKNPIETNGNPIIRSEGQLKSKGPVKKIIVEIGTKVLTKYSVFAEGYKSGTQPSVVNIPSTYTSYGPIHSNGPINFNGTMGSNQIVETAYQQWSLQGSWSGNDPTATQYADFKDCKPQYSPQKNFLCPPIWGSGTPKDNINKSPVASLDSKSIINDTYFDSLKNKALEEDKVDGVNPFYIDMNSLPGSCNWIFGGRSPGIYFSKNRITFHPAGSGSFNSFGPSFSPLPCYSISIDTIKNSKHKIIYFDHTLEVTNFDTGMANDYKPGDIMILGGDSTLGNEWSTSVTLASDTRMFVRSMDFKTVHDGFTSVGFVARQSIITNFRESRAFDDKYKTDTFTKFTGIPSSCSDPLKPHLCDYQPPITSGFSSCESLKSKQSWDASFLSGVNTIVGTSPYSAYGSLDIFGSTINAWGRMLGANWGSVTMTPNLGASPPGFPYLNDINIVSWREE